VLALAGAVGLAVIVVVAVSLLGGSSGSSSAKHTAGGTTAATTTTTAAHHKATKTTTKSVSHVAAANVTITVLNGTETAGLAHQISANLQQRGYSQAAALAGRPTGANQVTVVQYSAGHQPEAEAVASSLGVSQVQPLESTVSSLAGPAKVVVIVGHDKATSGP